MVTVSPVLPVFVYGLLCPRFEGFAELCLADRVDILGPDRITGTLYDLGDYPGLVPSGAGIVVGELLMPRDDGVLALLDAYELYDPANPQASEYVRVRVTTLDGGIDAWVYAYNRDVGGVPVIAGGRWGDL
jgi:gamma-glutamylcyclotransferase (GGCT)/AIG2-like uncharacterized protein YtfP